ncbi:hypothetical protein [Dermacoccus nishinomiyaensis]|uniref:hypothetical protein n=1 Tax=Dermacoccus nishinomiyaensis TaxID=1274 RepID=UPI001A9A173A|nr:hypothetical protein [Dermacoccus nishinomiyaensis]MCG7429303.1 hypothetical protein [Dermacoccus nishinomiyaensis]
MKKFAGLAAVGVGALAFAGAGASQAAETHISGNLQYTSMTYWCDKGKPNFAFGYRTLNKTESQVTFTASGFKPLVTKNVSPYTASRTVYAVGGYAGKPITVTAHAASTGSSFSVSGRVPSSCAGLPTALPFTDWSAAGKPTAQPVPTKPAPTKPAPTTPAPTKPAPTKPAPTTPAPTTTGQGPKVETDRVVTNQNDTTAAAVGLGALALAGGGLVVARRARR